MRKYKKKKVWLKLHEAQAMLDGAKSRSKRDYLLLSLMRYGLRVGEIVGWRGLPGMYPEDLRATGVWIKGKGYEAGIVQDIEMPIPSDILALLRQYIVDAKIPNGRKIFPISEPWAEEVVKGYARRAGIEDADRIGPHRLRAFFNTDMRKKKIDFGVRTKMMRHKNWGTTMIYEEEDLDYEEMRAVMEKVSTPSS